LSNIIAFFLIDAYFFIMLKCWLFFYEW
jgi:hypothetical protein